MKLELNGKALIGLAIAAASVSTYLSAARAGDLDPPAGAVGPTMRSLQDVGEGIDDLTELAQPRDVVPANIEAATLASISGVTQGDFPQDDVYGGMAVIGQIFDLSINIEDQYDTASGLASGKRQHKPLTITKHIDKVTPLLANSLANAENLSTVALKFFRPNPSTGATQHYFTIELINAQVVGVEHGLDQDFTGLLGLRERVSFTYDKIIWTYEDGGITAEDDWETPVVR